MSKHITDFVREKANTLCLNYTAIREDATREVLKSYISEYYPDIPKEKYNYILYELGEQSKVKGSLWKKLERLCKKIQAE